MIDRSKIIVVVSFIILSIIFITVMIVATIRDVKENRNFEFCGSVQSVKYEKTGFPTVKVNGKEYFLDDGYNFDNKIALGDSIVKKKGSTIYKLIKSHTGEIIYFDN